MDQEGASVERALSGSDHDRLSAARELARAPDPRLLGALRRAVAQEHVPWIRRALEQAVQAAESNRATLTGAGPSANEGAEQDLERRQIYADALHETTRRLLHEITPILGRARLAAERELREESTVGRELELLNNVCESMRSLAAASAVPDLSEFDLARALAELVEAEETSSACPIRASGQAPFIVTADRGLLEIATRNVLRNAVEASEELRAPGVGERPIVMNWGYELGGYWVSVIDRGPGPPSGQDAFRLGATTKEGHPGFGLATTRQAMESLGGNVEFGANERGGTTVVLHWPAPE